MLIGANAVDYQYKGLYCCCASDGPSTVIVHPVEDPQRSPRKPKEFQSNNYLVRVG